MSYQRDVFEIEVRFSQVKEYNTRDWVNGIDMLNALSMWEMLRALAALSESKRQEVVKAAEAILKQQRGWVKPFDRIAWAADIVTGNVFKSAPAGLFQIQPRMSQSSEETDAQVFLEEKKGGKKSEWITLGQPSVATNAAGISPRYHMQFTEMIATATSAQSIMDLVASKGPLKHWAISCHGFVNHDDGATRIALGQGLDHGNVDLFTKLKGKVDVIWIGGCFPASSDPGKEDCKARALNAGCYLVAPAFLVASKTGADLPRGGIELNRRFMPVVFKPDGTLLAWDNFLAMGKTLNFTVS